MLAGWYATAGLLAAALVGTFLHEPDRVRQVDDDVLVSDAAAQVAGEWICDDRPARMAWDKGQLVATDFRGIPARE
jgi:hypothetical protein